MTSIGKLIASYRKQKKLSQQELSDQLNQLGYSISNKAISKWEKDVNEPGIAVFFAVCRILEIPDLYEAYYGNNPYNPLSKLNELGKEKACEYITLLSNSDSYRKETASLVSFPKRTIPLQLYPVSAGPGNFLDDENYEDIPAGDDVPLSADFAVRISGDSMEPLFHKNQIVYVHKQDSLESDEIGIFFLDGEAYIKKFKHDSDGTFLISLNKNYPPKPVSENSDFRIFGKVV